MADIFAAIYFDGRTGRMQTVDAALAADGITWQLPGQDRRVWHLTEIRRLAPALTGGRLVLTRPGADPERLCLPAAAGAVLAGHMVLPVTPSQRPAWRSYLLAAGLFAAIMGCVILGTPVMARHLARGTSPQTEFTLGLQRYQAHVARLQRRQRQPAVFCAAPAGLQAMTALQDALLAVRPGWLQPKIAVLKSREINAYNLGGGYIVMTSGLIEFARSGDEVAGVLAHEIGHSEGRHHSRRFIEAGQYVVLSDLIFNTSAVVTAFDLTGMARLLAMRSRDMEREADSYAAATLRLAHVDPMALAEFSLRLKAEDGNGDGDRFFSSHPSLAERADLFRAAAAPGAPLLNPRQWRALRDVCARRATAAPGLTPKP